MDASDSIVFRPFVTRLHTMKSSRQPARGLRTIGASIGVMVLTAAALLSGCYYRGRSPEYGGRGYGHNEREHGHDRDRDHDHHYDH